MAVDSSGWKRDLGRMMLYAAPKIPLCSDRYVPEIRRLANRKIPTGLGRDIDDEFFEVCDLCHSNDHVPEDCSYMEDIPSDIKDLNPKYDRVCRGCGTIGMECCHEGSYAVRKTCSFCNKCDHWFWEERCPEEYPSKLRYYRLWKCFKDGKPIQDRPLQIPSEKRKKDIGELLRLMRRQQTCSSPPVSKGCCTLCYDDGHPYYECPYVEFIPDKAVFGPNFDEVCAGCGRIGLRCCDFGAYPVQKWCKFCHSPGHWYWEDKHVYNDNTRDIHDRRLVDKFKKFAHKVQKKSLQKDMVKLTT
ncbi:hypothetical protein ACHQM5_000031 [Ranunculus cassubicifolius]